MDIAPNDVGDKRIAAFEKPDHYFYQQTDISDEATFRTALDAAMKQIPKGSLFGAVHCAAVNPQKPYTGRMSDKIGDFEECLKFNALGTFLVDAIVADAINSQYEPLEPFHQRVTEERGSIVNIASVVAYDTPARCLTYGPSKTAVLGITNAAADFLAPVGIRVNSIAPCLVMSQMMESGGRVKFFEEQLDGMSLFPRRFTTPTELGEAILFLLEHPMMNAFHLKVDAGWREISNWMAGQDREFPQLTYLADPPSPSASSIGRVTCMSCVVCGLRSPDSWTVSNG